MQRKFQQSKVYENTEIPQVQFIDRLVVPVVTETGTHSAFSKAVETPLVQFLDRLLTPVVPRQVLMAQTVQQIVELPQVQLLFCCGRPCDHATRSSSPVARFSRDSVRRSAGHSSCAHSAVLEQGCCRCCVRLVPMVRQCRVRSSTRSSTSRFRTVAVPQIQSSTELNDVFEAVLAYFSDSPARGESRVARIFRALDDEEFFVVEGSSGVAPTPGVHSQVLGRRV